MQDCLLVELIVSLVGLAPLRNKPASISKYLFQIAFKTTAEPKTSPRVNSEKRKAQ